MKKETLIASGIKRVVSVSLFFYANGINFIEETESIHEKTVDRLVFGATTGYRAIFEGI